jgi:hypothetical protein
MDEKDRITDLPGLFIAMTEKRSVVVPKYPIWRNPIPAAFIINLQGAVILKLFESGMYLYKKQEGN